MKKQKITRGKVSAAVELQTPEHRCHLCLDGGVNKPLVEVTDSVRVKKWACQQHAAFYGRERTGVNRKYLPGNDTPPVAAKDKKPIEIAADAGAEEPRSKIKVRDMK